MWRPRLPAGEAQAQVELAAVRTSFWQETRLIRKPALRFVLRHPSAIVTERFPLKAKQEKPLKTGKRLACFITMAATTELTEGMRCQTR